MASDMRFSVNSRTGAVILAAVLTVMTGCGPNREAGSPPTQIERDLRAETDDDRTADYTGRILENADPPTLTGKVVCGYQGWFAAPGDGSDLGWHHYGRRSMLTPDTITFDLWPEMSEFGAEEKFATDFRHADGSTAYLFSPVVPATVLRHFDWMRQYGIDGVFLQRFGVSLRRPRLRHHRTLVTANVRAAARQTGRAWALMYDLSGLRSGEIHQIVMPDWRELVDSRRITADPTYLHHRGRPVVGVWGVGFNDGRAYTLQECQELIRFLAEDPEYGGNCVLVGVPTWWRSLTRDAVDDPRLHQVIQQACIVSPWTVGRYDTPRAADRHIAAMTPADMAWCRAHGLDYLPVVFPGFSWHNLKATQGEAAPLNAIPRQGGNFLWTQAVAQHRAGADMLYVAMFDEIDEGTAIFKCSNDPPVGITPFLTFEGLPPDHYLWLTGRLGELIRGQRRPHSTMPRRPGAD